MKENVNNDINVVVVVVTFMQQSVLLKKMSVVEACGGGSLFRVVENVVNVSKNSGKMGHQVIWNN